MVTVSQLRFTQKVRSRNKGIERARGMSLATAGLPTESKIANEKSYQPSHFCEGRHTLAKCSNFLKSVDQHSEIREKGHILKSCLEWFTHEECRMRNHTLLLRQNPKLSNLQSDTKE